MSQEFKITSTPTENIRENLSDIKGYVFRVLSNWKWFMLRKTDKEALGRGCKLIKGEFGLLGFVM